MDTPKAGLPIEHLTEVEVAIQLATLKMDLKAIRSCYKIAARLAHGAIDELKVVPM